MKEKLRTRSGRALAWGACLGAGALGLWQGYSFGTLIGGVPFGALLGCVLGLLATMIVDELIDRFVGAA